MAIKEIRIVIADEHMMICDAMGELLIDEPDLRVVAVAYAWDKALQMIKEKQPDIAVVALQMLARNSFELLSQIAGEVPDCRVIVLAESTDRRYLVEAFRLGIMGYVLKESPSSELIRAIRGVAGNFRYLDPRINDVILYEEKPRIILDQPSNRQRLLTQREQEVLRLMAEGRNHHDITMELDITIKTLEAHRRHILKKLKLRNAAELTRYAIKEGISPLD
jgi:DNA-binding NarL/FixJ family response regulator